MLLSLKAELLKKQEEVLEKKQLPQNKLENFKPHLPQKTEKNDKPEKKSFRDNLKEVDTDELEACRKSKTALEKKAQLYEHLADSAGTSELEGRFLIDFNLKKKQEPSKSPSPEPEDVSFTVDEALEVNGDWMEFTDCLGRTRKCLKTDLELYKKRDQELMKSMKKYEEIYENDSEDKKPKIDIEKPELVQKTNDYLQSLREKWEQKEQELLAKDKDIHYQDLLFDEARLHGVSYYSFSTDETERRKQMAELIKTREETLKAQHEAEERRKKRDELIEARVAAARARRRVRAGLPPEDPNEKQKDYTACLLEFLTQQKNEADSKAKELERKEREEKEKERQKQREAFVREWDIGKEKLLEDEKKFRLMTQEEYVEQERSRRIEEFAPLKSTRNKDRKSDRNFDSKGNALESNKDESSTTKTWADVRPEADSKTQYNIEEDNPNKGLYFSSNTKLIRDNVYKNFVRPQDPVLIVNELDVGNMDMSDKAVKRKAETSSAEIPPPPTFDYYGPVSKQSRSHMPFHSNLQEAFEQGVQALETKEGKHKLSNQYDFTF
ncbi:Coiled-coil domain-containing protein 174 [Eumeta japonica]|uniref:Coiled-coil domain-containing protein 174 n=1 Tax=Eumeta variegata TaxID=151549 RepID=A0A4C1TL38_EUMVA|nr:Coiled-coil domain-containing protein 174 [Eumeta japonica]